MRLECDREMRLKELELRQQELKQEREEKEKQPREVYSRLKGAETGDYELFKKALLCEFGLTPEINRKRFRSQRKTREVTYLQLANRAQGYAHKWTAGAQTKEDLLDLVVLEHVYEQCPSNLRRWLMDQKPENPQHAGQLADEFVNSHPPSTMEILMPAPICLIENSPAGELQVQQEALRVLAEIHQPVVVVAIAGLYRTGKSYLMNKLAGKRTGVLLDTEGLGDVEKGDTKNDTWIFALAVLLSSTLVYNSRGTIDQQAMDQLHYVTELTERIKVKPVGGGGRQEGADSAEFVRFFPAFVWAMRDFTLWLELDGREITEDEYLENALKLKTGSTEKTQLYNQPRECIRQFFRARKCFVFVPPASRSNLRRLEELQEAELEPEFREQVARFCRHIWEMSKPKTIPGGHVVTGAMLGNLAVTYVDTIRSGAVPCVESAVLALAQIENSAAVEEAMAVYEEQLGRQAALPTETLQELLELHAQCEREALRAFMARAFKDDDRRFQGELMRRLEEQKQELCRRNELASSDRCTAALLELWDELDDRIGQGVYLVPGGYQRFLDDRQWMVERYHQILGEGACLVLPGFVGKLFGRWS
ncbi:guanylate-binding protein 1-like [Chrysemys picta bellii]|uniref:guanylate-binding protein 1-like n=1 Tax=Chrysemys picta bellii TaxID=8478 RepID=UPI0032B1BF27